MELEPDTVVPSPYGPPAVAPRDRATEEYAAFGPWVTPVLAADDVPPVFARHAIDVDASILTLKFPRPEARRDLRVGMHLYDHLVVLTHTQITVLERHGDDSTFRAFALESIAALSSGARLLDGWLTLAFTTGETYTLPFNGSNSAVITGLIDRIRELVAPEPRGAPSAQPSAPLGMDDLGRDDALFTNVANALLEHDSTARILFAEGRTALETTGGWTDGMLHRLRPAVRQGSVVAHTPSELIVFSRVDPITRTSAPEVSLKRTIVQLRTVQRVEVGMHDHYAGTALVTLVCGQARVAIVLAAGSPAEEWLVQAFAR